MKHVRNGILSGIGFGILFGLYIWDFALGIVSGILFGIAMTIFLLFQSQKAKKVRSEMFMGKKIVFDCAANHFVGAEAVGGWLFLTDEELIFKSHKYNIQVHEFIIPINEIQKIEKSQTLGIVPNGLTITTKNGNTHKLVVNSRKKWLKLLSK